MQDLYLLTMRQQQQRQQLKSQVIIIFHFFSTMLKRERDILIWNKKAIKWKPSGNIFSFFLPLRVCERACIHFFISLSLFQYLVSLIFSFFFFSVAFTYLYLSVAIDIMSWTHRAFNKKNFLLPSAFRRTHYPVHGRDPIIFDPFCLFRRWKCASGTPRAAVIHSSFAVMRGGEQKERYYLDYFSLYLSLRSFKVWIHHAVCLKLIYYKIDTHSHVHPLLVLSPFPRFIEPYEERRVLCHELWHSWPLISMKLDFEYIGYRWT